MISRATPFSGWRAGFAAVATVALLCSAVLSAAFANDGVLEMQEDHAQWIMPNQNYQAWNYSELDEINRFNVQNLQVKWSFQTGVVDSHEAQPLVIGDTMYVLTPKPNTLIALDLSQNGYVKWVLTPEMDTERAGALACCGAQTRGLMYAEGSLFFNTLDGQLFRVNAETGEVEWQQLVADLDVGETTTNSPIVIGNYVITGNEGGERGVRGWVAAYDIDSGEEVWKFYNTGPDEDMGITDRFQPFYEVDQRDEVGVTSWYGDSWRTGGGTAWGYFSYDPDTNQLFYGTSNCSPWNPDYRRDPATAPGFEDYGNKYCASIIARDATTGEMTWAYSVTPQDQWDFDEPGQNFVVDLRIDGEMRQTLVRPARNGFFYVHDRNTGELLSEPQKYTTVTWADGIDMETGIPDVNPDAMVFTDVEAGVCPWIAGNNWFNDAYSPRTGLVYYAAQNVCGALAGTEGDYVPGENYLLARFIQTGDIVPETEGEHPGMLLAWDPVRNEQAWMLESVGGPNSMPLLATAGDLIFQGTEQGSVRAVDARSGEVLWQFRTGSNFRNSPIAYVGPDGRQYIAIIASQAPSNPNLGEETPADAAARYRRAGSTLYVFGLP